MRANATAQARFQSVQFGLGLFTLEQVGDVRDRGLGDILRGRILADHTRRKLKSGSAKEVLHKSRTIHRPLAREEIVPAAKFRTAKRDEGAEQFAERIARAGRDEFQPFAQEARSLDLRQTEIEHGQRRVELFIEVFRNAIFLNAETDVPAMKLEIGFDDPVMAVVAFALEKKCMGPCAPFFPCVNVAFGAANCFVDESDAA